MPSPRIQGFTRGNDTRKTTRSQRSRRVRDKASDGGAGGGAGSRRGLGFLLEKGGYAIDDFGEGRARAEAGEGFEFIDAGDPAHHVFEAGLVSFVVGDEFDGGVAARTLLYELRKFFDGNFFVVADVHNFADGMLRVNQTNERFDGVADIAETPRL